MNEKQIIENEDVGELKDVWSPEAIDNEMRESELKEASNIIDEAGAGPALVKGSDPKTHAENLAAIVSSRAATLANTGDALDAASTPEERAVIAHNPTQDDIKEIVDNEVLKSVKATASNTKRERKEFKFIPIKKFEWIRENGFMVGQYWPGMSYNCSRLPVHDDLYRKCMQWDAEDMIKIFWLTSGQEFVMNEIKK